MARRTAKVSPALISKNKERPIAGPGAVLSPKSVRIIERRYQVVTLRREGWSVQEIADVLGCSAAAVHNDLTEVLAQSVNETAETTAEARQLQAERLDMMLKQFMPMTQDRVVKIVDPDQPYRLDEEGERVPNYRDTIIPASLAAAQMVIQIEARRSKLQALDVPETKNLNVTGVREYIGVDVEQV